MVCTIFLNKAFIIIIIIIIIVRSGNSCTFLNFSDDVFTHPSITQFYYQDYHSQRHICRYWQGPYDTTLQEEYG